MTFPKRIVSPSAINASDSTFRSPIHVPVALLRGRRTNPSTRVRFPSPAPILRFSAKEFFERLEKPVRKVRGFFAERIQLLRELHLIAAMNFTRRRRNLVGGNIDLVGGPGRFATGGREVIRKRTDQRVLDRHRRLQILR